MIHINDILEQNLILIIFKISFKLNKIIQNQILTNKLIKYISFNPVKHN